MIESIKKIFKRADTLPKNGVGAFEWVCFALAAVVAYVFFCHQDILITAGHSIEYLNGHITDFYTACKKVDGVYAANYLPSTFIVFAVWNIPMKLFGLIPGDFGDWNVAFMLWNKLLPTVAYFVCGFVLYRLCVDRLNFDRKKAALTMLLGLSAPTAFFTQFIFCQYDVFTVLFMLLGMYCYFKKSPTLKDHVLFSLFFGIATTFKYFALVIFAVFLFLRVKNVIKVLLLSVISVFPAAAEAAFYFVFDFKAFKKSVFGFSALDYTEGFSIDLGDVSVNLMVVFIACLAAFAYFTKAKNYEEIVGYSMFYSSGVCFAIFGMMMWHPQWLLFIMPFWAIGTAINKNYKMLILLDALFGIVFLVYIVNQFSFTLEGQGLMRYGILMDTLRYKVPSALKMADLFVFKNTDILFSIISALLLIGFIFKHPKYNLKSLNESISDGRFVVNIRFLAFALALFAALFATLPGFVGNKDLLWRSYDNDKKQSSVIINNSNFAQERTRLDKMTVTDVYAVIDTARGNEDNEKAEVCVDVIEASTNKVISRATAAEKNIKDGSFKFTKLHLDKPVKADGQEEYIFKFYTSSSRAVSLSVQKNVFGDLTLLRTYQKDYSSAEMYFSGEKIDGSNIAMKLLGETA